jgi:hypothetical protein
MRQVVADSRDHAIEGAQVPETRGDLARRNRHDANRVYEAHRGPPFEFAHTYAPCEPSADEIMPTARATHRYRYASRLTQVITVAERCTDPVDVAIIGRCMADGERNR